MKKFLTAMLGIMLIVVSSFTTFGFTSEQQPDKITDFTLMENQINIINEDKNVVNSTNNNAIEKLAALNAPSNWNLTGVSVNNKYNYVVGDIVVIKPITTGNTSGVKYKYVWSRNNWSSWGVIGKVTTSNFMNLKLSAPGEYMFTVDAIYGDKVISKSVTVNVKSSQTSAKTWNLTGVSTDKKSYYTGDIATIKPITTGNVSGVKYKYVWSKDNWSSWGVLNASGNTARIKLTVPGEYMLTVDAIYGDKVISKSVTVNVTSSNTSANIWNLTGVSTDKKSYYTGDIATIKPITTGNVSGVKYKYVWSKDNWSSWGVLNASGNTARIKLTVPGEYMLTVDAIYGDKVISKSVTVNVSANWSHNGGNVSGNTPYRLGEVVRINALASGSVYGAKYKFVYEYDNWGTWGVIQAASTANYANFAPPKAGKCNIHIDITSNGVTKTKSLQINVQERWYHSGVTVVERPIYKLNNQITLSSGVNGLKDNLKYKFVYSKDDWEEWGVIQAASTASTAKFTPKKSGVYEIIVDISDNRGRIQSMSTEIIVSNSGWVISDYSFSNASPIVEGTSTAMKFNVKGYNMSGIRYKFVAHNTTTGDWYILKALSTSNSYTWTPQKAGLYNIYMEAEDSKGNVEQKIVNFSVNSKINSSVKVSLSNSSATIPQGKSMYLKKESVSPSSAAITFVSNNTNVATVDANKGYVYAKSNGSTQIRAVDSQGKTAAICEITVSNSEPIRFAYSSPNSAPKGSSVTMYAITDKTRTNVRFEVNGKTINAAKKVAEGGTYVWSGSVTLSNAGTYDVRAYSYKNGSWTTCANGNTTIYMTNSNNTTTTTSERRRTSDKGINFIAESEGFSSGVYDDAGGTPTLGYGKVIYGGDQFYNNLTKTEGYAMLLDLVNNGSYSKYVNDFLVSNGLKFNQHQFDALVSFSYNKGASWTLAMYEYKYPMRGIVLASGNKDLNNINKTQFAKEFNSQHHLASNGKCLKGLLDRRINELEIFFYNDYVRQMPPPQTSNNSWFYEKIEDCPNYK